MAKAGTTPPSEERYKIGITGGIGAGKSLVAMVLERLGFPVYWADSRARLLMQTDEQLKKRIRKAFGEESYHPDGSLNARHLSRNVFQQPAKLRRLNNFVHPAVKRDFLQWAQTVELSPLAPFVFKEAAIVYEARAEDQLDWVWLVYAPLETRIRRTLERDESSREQVLQRIGRQWPSYTLRQRAETTIFNDGHHLVLPQILRALEDTREAFSLPALAKAPASQ